MVQAEAAGIFGREVFRSHFHRRVGWIPGASVVTLIFLVTGDGAKYARPGNTKWGSITVPLTSCLTGLD